MTAIQPEQVLRRRGPGIERGDEVRGLGVVFPALPGVVGAFLQRLPVAGDAGDLAHARIVDQVPERGRDAYGALLQPAVHLVEILREAVGGVPLPVDAVEDVEGLRRVALDREDVVGAAAFRDQLRGLARRVQRIEGDHPAADVAALQQVVRGRQLAALVVDVQEREGRAGGVVDKGHGLVMAVAVAVGAPLSVSTISDVDSVDSARTV